MNRHRYQQVGNVMQRSVYDADADNVVDRAESIDYTPGTEADWPGDIPTDVLMALDELASRLTSSSGPLIPADDDNFYRLTVDTSGPMAALRITLES